MPIIIRYQLLIFLALVVTPVIGLLANPIIEAVQKPEIDNSICVDTEPFNDGYGWNGACGCQTEHSPNISFETADQDILLMSGSSPAACTGSSVLYTYTKTDEGWKVSDRLTSTHNQPYDNFPDNVKVVGDTMVATSGRFYSARPDTYPYITLFQKDSTDTWSELQSIVVDSPVPEWRNSVVFDGETLIFSYRDDNGEYPIFVYEKSTDGFWYETARLSTTEPERTYQQDPHLQFDGGTLAALHTSDPKVVFFEKINGQWLKQNTLELSDYTSGHVSSNYNFENGILIVGLTSFERQSNGEWVERPRDTTFGHLTRVPQTLLTGESLSFDIRRLLPSNPEEPCYSCRSDDLRNAMSTYQLDNGNWLPVDYIYLDTEHEFYSQAHYDQGDGEDIVFFDNDNLYVYSIDSDGYFNGGELSRQNNSSTDNDCDYSNALQYDGWGWNATNGTSCPPLTQMSEPQVNDQTIQTPAGCDYSNAAQYGGWGWNPGTSTSCPPVSSPVLTTSTAISPLSFDAVSSNPTVRTIAPEITAQCVDVAPFNDNWGWNGTCSCELTDNPEYEDYGDYMNMRNSTVFVSSASSPQACYGSGSVLVYNLDDNGQLRKEAELLPAARTSRDGFADRELKDHHIADDLVAPFTWQTVTVFGREGGSWTELYTQDRESGHAFLDDELIISTSTGIKRYDARTGQLKSTLVPGSISEGCQPFIKHIHNQMLVLGSSCGTEVYEKQASGELEFQLSYSGEYELTRVDNNQIFFSFLTSNIDTSEDRITYTRNADGGWTETESVNNLTHRWNTTNAALWSSHYSDYFPVSDSDTVLTTNFGFDTEIAIPTPRGSSDPNPAVLFYQRAPDADWSLAQEVPLTNILNTRSHRSKDGLFLTFSTSGSRLEIDSLFKDSSGQWKYLFDTRLDTGWPRDVQMYQNHLFITSAEGLHHLTAPITQYSPAGGESDSTTVNTDPDCDYSSANLFGGWGWNERLSESCPPLNNTGSAESSPGSVCVDSDGDGWGWDGVASCRMP